MLGKKGPSVTKCVHYEIVTNRRIIPSFFSEIEIDLPGKSYEKDQLIIEISGKFAFEMYFDDMVVPELDSNKLATDGDKIFAEMWTHNDRYFRLSPVKTKGSALHYRIQKKNAYTYKIEVKSSGKCAQSKLKIFLYSTAVDIHDLAFNRKMLIKDFVSVEYSYKSTRKTVKCKFNQISAQKDEKDLEKKRIKIGNAPNNEDGRLRLVHTKQYITLKALSKFKPPQLTTKGKKQIVVTYVGPDDLTNMETSLAYLGQICEQKGINERKVFVRADMVNENTSDSKLVEIVKRFTGRSTDSEKIGRHESDWHESDIIIDTCTINYWRFSKDYENVDPNETNIYKEEISKRISYLKPGGILYLVFPSFVSGFGKLFDDRYQTMDKETDLSRFRDTDDVITELNSIYEEIKKTHTNIMIEMEGSHDYDGGFIVIRHKGDSYSEEDTNRDYQDQTFIPSDSKQTNEKLWLEFPIVDGEQRASTLFGKRPIGGLESKKVRIQIKRNPNEFTTETFYSIRRLMETGIEQNWKVLGENLDEKVDDDYILSFAEEFVEEFATANRSRVELAEMDELIPYLNRKGITYNEIVALVGLEKIKSEREMIASIVKPIPLIREQRNESGKLTHYEIHSERTWDNRFDFDLGDRELLRASAAAA